MYIPVGIFFLMELKISFKFRLKCETILNFVTTIKNHDISDFKKKNKKLEHMNELY